VIVVVVEIADLQFRWNQTDSDVLDIESLQIQAGQQVFIAGPSGSGKSTLLSLLAGVNTALRGSVKVLDQRLEKLGGVERDHFRANHIGYIFQMFNLIPYLSVVENVLLPCHFSKTRQEKALASSETLELEAKRLLAHLDMAHDDLLSRPVTSLSVGQQQRVAAARALIGSPEIIIADEPTSSLDANRRESFVKLLFDECRQSHSTLVFVSHDMALQPMFSHNIDLLDINRVAAQGF